MYSILYIAVFICLRFVDGRLIERNIQYKSNATENKSEDHSPSVRISRQVFDEGNTGYSKEEQSEEILLLDVKNPSKVVKASPKRALRVSRDSSESDSKNNSHFSGSPNKSRIALVKKPIPKYTEIDYDDDFQMKMFKAPLRFADSGEHEDEDFNINDYEFDINHDEFIGRGRPLEPRLKMKERKSRPSEQKQKPAPAPAPEMKIQSKLVIPAKAGVSSIKKQRAAELVTKKAVGREEDYYDEVSTTKIPEKENKGHDSDDEFNDENDDSKEYETKIIRTIRSPLNTSSNLAEEDSKPSKFISKVLSILPMFPQVPSTIRQNENKHANRVPNIS